MTCQELSTAVKYHIGVIVVIYNNNSWGFIRNKQQVLYERHYMGVDLLNPDFAAMAKLFGAEGFHVEKPEDISPAFNRAKELSGKGVPVVLDCIVDLDEKLLEWTYSKQ